MVMMLSEYVKMQGVGIINTTCWWERRGGGIFMGKVTLKGLINYAGI